MRLALISDLQAPRLRRLICLGDVATQGPQPSEMLARLQQLGCPCLVGNHDEFMLTPQLVDAYSPMPPLRQSVHETRARSVRWRAHPPRW